MSETEAARALRERAMEQAQRRSPEIPEDLSAVSVEDARSLLHDLHVHRIELELQNDELRSSQEQLEQTRARYFELYDLAPVGYVTISEQGIVLEANLTAAGLLDAARSVLLQRPWTRFVFPADQDIYSNHHRQLLASGAPHGCELRLLKSNGESFWVRLEARVAGGENRTRVVRTVLSDITERKCAEELLRSSEARHRLLFQNSPDALLTLAPPSWQFLSGNNATMAMFAAPDERDFLLRSFGYYSPERQADGSFSSEKIATLLAGALRAGSGSFEWTFRRGRDEEFSAAVSVARMETGGAPFLQATVHDQTEARKQEAERAQTERLASMGLLAASMGHEINNPLVYVLSNVEDLTHVLPRQAAAIERCRAALRKLVGEAIFAAMVGEDSALLEPAQLQDACKSASDALDGAQRITRISKALSTFSRVDSSDRGPVQLQHAIECAIAMASNEIRFRAALILDFKLVPLVWASEGNLSQVFLNLLLNASHAMDEGGDSNRRITVSTWTENDAVFAAVDDTGAGISAENLARIFEPFFSTKRSGAGTGLGLSICRNIIGEFGGEIGVESKVGQGTRFVVRLPIWVETATPQLLGASAPAVAALANLRGRILIIDDEGPVRLAMGRLLAAHDVISASSGKEALQILEQDQAFDLILCDVMMEEVTGMDVHRWLVARNSNLAQRMVFISGGAFGAGAAAYLSGVGNLKIDKPFDAKEFKDIVSSRVRDAKSEPPARVDSSIPSPRSSE